MMYTDKLGNEYRTHSAIRKAFPGVNFPVQITEGFLSSLGVVPKRPTFSKPALISARVLEFKAEARKRIEATAWRLERAQEREVIQAPGESVKAVLREREAIRRASNRLEKELLLLNNMSEIQEVLFEVRPSDYPPVTEGAA